MWSEGSQHFGSPSALVEEGTNEAIAPSARTPFSSRLRRLLCRHCSYRIVVEVCSAHVFAVGNEVPACGHHWVYDVFDGPTQSLSFQRILATTEFQQHVLTRGLILRSEQCAPFLRSNPFKISLYRDNGYVLFRQPSQSRELRSFAAAYLAARR